MRIFRYLSRREKNKEDSTQKWRGRMWVALGYECLHQAKQSKPAEYIERHYPQLRQLLRGNRALLTSLRGWHHAFMTGRAPGSQDSRVKGKPPEGALRSFGNIYRKELKLDENLGEQEYRQLAKACLSKAAEIAGTIPGGL